MRHRRWVMISVDLDGTANVVGSRIVEGGAESQCATAQELEAMNTMSHPDHYVEVSFTPPTSSSSGVANTGIVFPTCTIVTRDPRLTHYQQHRHRGSDHHEHHHDDHDHDDQEKNNQPASSLQKNSLALRLPEGVLELSVSAVDHLVKQHQTPAGAAKATTRTSFTFKTTALQLGEPHHELRRTATELGNTVVTIPTSQLAATALQEVGNPSETFNIVLVSSGYQGNEDKGYFDNYDTVEFLNFLRNATTTVATQPSPFDVYYSTFNIYSVWFSSDERGASKPSQGISVQNNLECSFGPTVTSNLACNNNKVLLAASYAPTDPQRTLIVVLVRDTWSGGSGGGGIAVYSTESDTLLSASNRLGIALHQIGHAWAGVSDEFSYGYDETMHVTMKNCYWQSYNTPWQAYTDNRVVRESQLGCSFNNYYGPTGGNCVMARTTYPSFCPVCKFFTLDALYSKGMKLVTPTYPHLDETMYVTVNTAANLYVNQYLPVMINGVDGTNRFRTTWTVIFAGNTFQVAFNTYTYQFNFSAPGTYVVNVTIEDRTTIILDQNRQAYETRGGNGPTATLQQYSFRVVNVANAASTGCSSKVATGFGTSYCAICDAGKTCTYSYLNTATPRLSATVYHADLEGLEVWMVAVGIVFVVVGIIIFVVAWRVMNAHQESNPVEILPLTDNIMIVRGVLIAVQILVLLIATFTIIYCVYQYGQLTVFGQSILLGVIACAVVVWLGSYLGVVAAYYKSRSLLFVNFILLLLLFGCVLLFSILLVYTLTNVNNSGVIDQLSSEWQSAVESRPYDVCQLENYMQCSGFNSSCAAFALTSPQGSTFCPSNCASNTNTNPCLSYIQDFVKSHFGSASAGGWVLTALLLAALILSVLLGCAIKNRRNNVHRERRVRHATGQNILLPEEIAMLRKEFNKIDKDGSGDISREEFSLFYNAVMGTDLSPRELEEYFDKLDADGNGNLSFEEFLKVYVPHREPRRKSMVKPKNVVEISSSSSSSDEDEKNAAAAAANKNRAAQYEQTSQSNGYDEEFAFEAPKKAASPPPQSGRSSNNGNLNISNQSSQQQAGRSPKPSNAGGRTPQAQPVDLRTSYQS
ncbi:peptidase, putative [Bodo saltans]|uniref:Peptidase, putative n=1 Tax=Bodo saltans TaxID=75058 RepID=A0A0S4IRL8_BODSA|nr:peptidase, putative [Bodo saltans]|eukprot:CUE74223.1 peptidase, putative [Bodo saltans]